MKKFLISLFVLFGLFSLASCNQGGGNEGNEFEQNDGEYVPDIHMWVVGSHWAAWTPANCGDNEAFVKDQNSSGLDTKYTITITVTQEMVDAWCGFKFTGDQSWNSQYGMEDVDFEKSNKAFLDMVGDKDGDGDVDAADKLAGFKEGVSNRNNIEVKTPGTLVIEYYPYNFTSVEANDTTYSCKFVVNFTPAA